MVQQQHKDKDKKEKRYPPSHITSSSHSLPLSAATSNASSCLAVGLSILKEQVPRCHGMEVQEACITLHELVAIPRHVLGHHAPVYGLMLRKVGRVVLTVQSSAG